MSGEGEPAEKQQVVTPWDVEAEDGVDYDKLMRDFGAQPITPELIARVEKCTGRRAHVFLRRGLFYSHRCVARWPLPCSLLDAPPPCPLFVVVCCVLFAALGVAWFAVFGQTEFGKKKRSQSVCCACKCARHASRCCHAAHSCALRPYCLLSLARARSLRFDARTPSNTQCSDLEKIVELAEQGKPFYLYTGRGPSSDSLHMGHLIPFMFTK